MRKNRAISVMTPEELEAKVNAYFAECEAQDIFPDRANMIVHLGLPMDIYLKYESDEENHYTPFADVLRAARLKREGWLSRIMFSDKNKLQSAIFQLRQPVNGGYSDRQEAGGAVSILLKISGNDSELLD